MIARLLLYLFLNERRFQYPSYYRYIMQALSAYLTLLVYYFTSIAFRGILDLSTWRTGSYFEFILIGELVLMIPLAATAATQKAVRFASNEGLLEDLLLNPYGLLRPLTAMSTSYLGRELVQGFFLLFFSISFFDFSPPPGVALEVLLISILLWPAFIGLGHCGGAYFLMTGRGEGLIGQFIHLVTIFAGAYFPLSILPADVGLGLNYLSPFTWLLETSREILSGHDVSSLTILFHLILWNVVGCTLGWATLRLVTERIYRRGLPTLSHP